MQKEYFSPLSYEIILLKLKNKIVTLPENDV